ncbi:MAG: hypothetical protein QW797_08820 [Thermoproteota archaeon]|nr:hypothetical protein [Candidatus Brockarchaeota archaeon]
MDRHALYLATITILFTASASTLAALGENRLDVYFSVYTLEYFTLAALFRPRRRGRDFLGAALLIGFSYVVALRILEILFPL